jgi:hypothetical protein
MCPFPTQLRVQSTTTRMQLLPPCSCNGGHAHTSCSHPTTWVGLQMETAVGFQPCLLPLQCGACRNCHIHNCGCTITPCPDTCYHSTTPASPHMGAVPLHVSQTVPAVRELPHSHLLSGVPNPASSYHPTQGDPPRRG